MKKMEKLNNPLFTAKPENNIPKKVLASVYSPVSNAEMVLCNIKVDDGEMIPVYVCLQDRVCLPVRK